MSTLKVVNIQHPSAASATLILDSSGNLALPAGSASTPALQGPSDTNTGLFFPAADTIAFAEGGTEALRIDSSGRVGIGTSSPSGPLHVTASSNGYISNTFSNTSAGTSAVNRIQIGNDASDGTGQLVVYGSQHSTLPNIFDVNNATNAALRFLTNNTERVRITGSGLVGIGTTSPSTILHVASTAPYIRIQDTDSNTGVTAQGGFEMYDSDGDRLFYLANESSSSADVGLFNMAGGALKFGTSGSERGQFDSSGRLLVGTTTSQCAVSTLKSVDTNSIGHFQTFAFYKGGLGQNPTNTNVIAVTLPNSTGISVTIMLNVRLTAYQNTDQGGERSATYCINLLRISCNGGTASNAVQANVAQIGSDITTSVGAYSVGSLTVSVDTGSSSTGSVTAYIRVSGTSTSGASDTRVYMSGYSMGSPNNQPTIAAA